MFEIVSSAIQLAEKMLRESKNVADFNAKFERSKGITLLLRKSHPPAQAGGSAVISWRREEYTKAKDAIEPFGEGLGRDFIQHFLPPNSVASNSTLQTAIAAYYQEQSVH